MPLDGDHWTDHLTQEEAVQLDDIQRRIARLKDKIADLRKLFEQLLQLENQ